MVAVPIPLFPKLHACSDDCLASGRIPCSMEFVTKQIAPLLPSSPFERIVKFRYIAWGNAHWNDTQAAGGKVRAVSTGP